MMFGVFPLFAFGNNSLSVKNIDAKDTSGLQKSTLQASQSNINVTIDTLYIKVDSFKMVPRKKKIFFVFTYKSPDKLSLYGWLSKNRKYDANATPTLKLELTNGPADTHLTIPAELGFGNIRLDKKQIAAIKDSIDKHKQDGIRYVLFIPVLAPDNARLQYNIVLSKDAPPLKEEKTASVINTGVSANPSPPKNY